MSRKILRAQIITTKIFFKSKMLYRTTGIDFKTMYKTNGFHFIIVVVVVIVVVYSNKVQGRQKW